jgi:demethylmenaquinone methyltransferase/2-methoxy-6-polyprenyl-1,4-benzoquinol methylase
VLLDVAHPEIKVIKEIYFLYYDKILPRLSRIFSKGHGEVYSYLPQSLRRFLKQKELVNISRKIGFSQVAYKNILFGTAVIYTLIK